MVGALECVHPRVHGDRDVARLSLGPRMGRAAREPYASAARTTEQAPQAVLASRHTLTLHPPAPCRRSQGAGDGECGKQRVEQEQRRERRGKPQKADRSRQVRCSSPRSGGPDGPRRRPGSSMLPGHPRRRRPPWKLQIGHPTEVAAQCEKRPFARGLRARATGRVTVSDPDEGSAEPSGDAGSARCSRSPETGFGCSRRMA
jgi:hypothetical protein